MNFIPVLTLREIRFSWKRLLFFFVCISVGVGSIVALRSLIKNLNKAVAGDARLLLTADFEISSTNYFSPNELTTIESVLSKSDIIEAKTETLTTTAMVRIVNSPKTDGLKTDDFKTDSFKIDDSKTDNPKVDSSKATGQFQFVELKGIEEGFPLVGEFTLLEGKPFEMSLLSNNGAIVHFSLLEKLGLRIGDIIRIGTADFQIRGVFYEEPGGSSGFRLGPRVFIEKRAFDQAGLVGRVRRKILFRTSSDPTNLVKELREKLKGTILTVNSYKEVQENLGNQFDRIENYLSLAGFLILVLGGVGVWNVARVFVEQKRKTIAILKCLGATGRETLAAYLLQILALSLLGSLFGILMAQTALWIVKLCFSESLPEKMSYLIQTSAVAQGILLGISISLLFSILPLLQIRKIKPNTLLRDDNYQISQKLDKPKWLFAFFCLITLLGLSIWQAGSIKVGFFFLIGLGLTILVLYFAASVLMLCLRKLRNPSNFAVFQAINSLYRPGNQTRIILLAVGLGAFVIFSVQSLRDNLAREFDFSRNQKLPSLFIVDIQRSQIEKALQITEQITGEKQTPIPTVRARIVAINGEPFDFEQVEIRQQQGQIGREFAVTYRNYMEENENLSDGQWWQDVAQSEDEAEVSVEENMSKTLKIGVGNYLTFDVLGRKITAVVSNIRKIDIHNTRTAFVFVFRPGILEKAPQTFLLPVTKRLSLQERVELQRRLLEEFPNVQILDTADILNAIGRLINNFVLAVSFVGSFVILTGILILIGSIALTKSQRIYENAILKTLGANRRILVSILLLEYLLLGLLASFLGSIFSILLSYSITEYVLKINWEMDLLLHLAGTFWMTLIVVLVGILSSFGLIFKKPMNILRLQ
jgi:putative ABC transport system permease protein